MKRAGIIIGCGALLGLLAGAGVYFMHTAPQRAMLCRDQPELAWLQREFQLTEGQFARVQKRHNEYLVHCKELCARIAATNELLRAQIAATTNVTLETETLLATAGQLRLECQTRMLEECFAVSREMSPEQGKRYLAWVQTQILVMPHEQSAEDVAHSEHGH